MSLLAFAWLSYQSYRYFADPKIVNGRTISEGGIDLRNRYRETQSWFRGEPVYNMYRDGVYAPASYAIFGVLFNKLPWIAVKVLWYLLSFALLGVLSWKLTQYAQAQSGREHHSQFGIPEFGNPQSLARLPKSSSCSSELRSS